MHQTTYVPKQTNHLLHLVLTFATCGAWGFVWIAVAIWNAFAKDKTTTVTSGWYGPVARPYEVGPGAPVGGQNPASPTPPVATPPMPPYDDHGSGWTSATRPPSEKMPPYVGYGPGWPVNMARPPALPVVPPHSVASYRLQPFQQDDGLMSCGLLGCTYQTRETAQMAEHRATPHHPASPQ